MELVNEYMLKMSFMEPEFIFVDVEYLDSFSGVGDGNRCFSLTKKPKGGIASVVVNRVLQNPIMYSLQDQTICFSNHHLEPDATITVEYIAFVAKEVSAWN